MKIIITLALLAVIGGARVWAQAQGPTAVPDLGGSVLLLTISFSALAFARRYKA